MSGTNSPTHFHEEPIKAAKQQAMEFADNRYRSGGRDSYRHPLGRSILCREHVVRWPMSLSAMIDEFQREALPRYCASSKNMQHREIWAEDTPNSL
jgi:hypothetical protein